MTTQRLVMPGPQKPLPEFERPPINEVALAVQFEPLANWTGLYAGLYWNQIKQEYPKTESHPPLASQTETFGANALFRPPTFQVVMNAPDMSRFWFLSEPPTKLIQLQRDRFIINWRKVKADDIYPRYLGEMRPRFTREWNGLNKFLAEQSVGTINVQQCEVTYVNDFEKGRDWSSFSEALSLFAPFWGNGSDGFLQSPETFAQNASFAFPNEAGRLHANVQHALRQNDQSEVIRFSLVARGKPSEATEKGILDWFDMGHEWIVRGFADLTSARAHKLWGRKI